MNTIKDTCLQKNIEILKINEYECTYKCLKCGAIKTNCIDFMIRNKNNNFHNEFCSKYFNYFIKNDKGYEKGNIRFVPLHINLINRDFYCPVMAINIYIKEVIEADSITELARIYFDENKISAIHNSIINNSIYLKTWKVFFTIKSVSTIES